MLLSKTFKTLLTLVALTSVSTTKRNIDDYVAAGTDDDAAVTTVAVGVCGTINWIIGMGPLRHRQRPRRVIIATVTSVLRA